MPRKLDHRGPPPRLAECQAGEGRLELERILASPLFRASRRCQNLLRRIGEQTLAGDVDSLKERTLGIEVFGRSPDYDTSQDPVVRASAGEIRKKLAQYYQEPGHKSPTRIELPTGSYIAEFHFGTRPEVADAARPTSRKSFYWIAGGIAVASLLLVLMRWGTGWSQPKLDALWNPLLKAPEPVLLCVGLQAAYNLRSAQAQDAAQGVIRQPSDQPPMPVIEKDLVLLRDRYVALDDTICLIRVVSLLEKFKKPYRIRGERATSFADLRDTPAVLIGAFDNSWTLRTGSQLRFTYRKDSEHDTGMICDRQHPENTSWKLTNYWPDWDIPFDYAIVTRLLDSTTDRPVMVAAGLTQYGTLGAGEFLSNPEYFSEATRQLPQDWPKKNLQVVLGVPVVNRISGRPRVLATHVW